MSHNPDCSTSSSDSTQDIDNKYSVIPKECWQLSGDDRSSLISSESDRSGEILREWHKFLQEIDDGQSSSSAGEPLVHYEDEESDKSFHLSDDHSEQSQSNDHSNDLVLGRRSLLIQSANALFKQMEYDLDLSPEKLRSYWELYSRFTKTLPHRKIHTNQDIMDFFSLSKLPESEISQIIGLAFPHVNNSTITDNNVNEALDQNHSLTSFIAGMHLISLRIRKSPISLPLVLPDDLEHEALLSKLSSALFHLGVSCESQTRSQVAQPSNKSSLLMNKNYSISVIDNATLAPGTTAVQSPTSVIDKSALRQAIKSQGNINAALRSQLKYWTLKRDELVDYRTQLESILRAAAPQSF